MADANDPELQYNSRKTVPDHAGIAARWDEEAEAYRREADMEEGIPYGTGPRARFDLFRGAGKDAPLIVFIHGGYWRSRGRETFSHVARNFNARGISVAIPSYDLCPEVTVMEIIVQMRACLARLWELTGQYPAVAGHSAGGHLTASMLATDWSAVDGAPQGLVRAAFGISGLYDLAPLRETSVNEDLNLTTESARAASPVFMAPPAGSAYVAAVGGAESEAFKWQSRSIVEGWAQAGVRTDYVEIAGANHFTIVNALTAPENPIAARIAAMAEQAAGGPH